MPTPSVAGTPQAFNFLTAGTVTYTGGGTTSNSIDVLCINSDTTITVTGWTAAATRVNSQGAYIFTCDAGTASSAAVNLTGSFNTSALWVRITDTSGLDTGATTTAGVDGVGASSSPSITSGALATATQLALAFFAGHALSATPPNTYVWSSGYTAAVNGASTSGGTTSQVAGAVATKAPAGTAAESPSVSWSNGVSDRYMLFVSFKASVGQTIAPTGIAVPATTGSQAVSQALSVAPSGVAVPATTGSQAVSQALSVAPSGIAVPASKGSQAVSQALSVAPSGIAVPAALGTPSVAMIPAGSISPAGIAVPVGVGTPTVNQTIPPSFACSPAGIAVPVTVGNPTLTQAAPPSEGNWNSLFDAINTARAEHERNAERRRHPVECPQHGWPLQEVDGLYHCMFGGHIVRPC